MTDPPHNIGQGLGSVEEHSEDLVLWCSPRPDVGPDGGTQRGELLGQHGALALSQLAQERSGVVNVGEQHRHALQAGRDRSVKTLGTTVRQRFADLVRNAVGLALAVTVGVALGFRVRGGVTDAVAGLVLVLAFSYALSWLFACIGMMVRTPQVAQMAGFLPGLPLTYLSGAWILVESMSVTVQAFARNQPVDVLVATLRSLANGSSVADTAWQAVAWTIGILAVSVP